MWNSWKWRCSKNLIIRIQNINVVNAILFSWGMFENNLREFLITADMSNIQGIGKRLIRILKPMKHPLDKQKPICTFVEALEDTGGRK